MTNRWVLCAENFCECATCTVEKGLQRFNPTNITAQLRSRIEIHNKLTKNTEASEYKGVIAAKKTYRHSIGKINC